MLALVLLLIWAAAPAWAEAAADWETTWQEMLAGAKKEGTVVVSGGTNPILRQQAGPRFKSRFGLAVEFVLGRGGEIAPRVRSERAAGLYTIDAFIGGIINMVGIFYTEKMLEPLRPALIYPEVTDPSRWKKGKLWFVDPEQRFVLRLLDYVEALMFVNTDHVRPGDITSAKDLLNPRWTARIAIRDPTSASGGAGDAARFYTQFGEGFVKTLYVDQKPAISRDSRQIADWLAHGKYPIAIGAAMEEIQLLRKEGFPVAIVHRLSDLSPATTSSSGLLGLANRAPHPNAARLFVNWIASREGAEILGRASGYPTTRKDVDELSYAPAELIPSAGTESFDAGSWDFAQVKEKIRLRMKELLKQ